MPRFVVAFTLACVCPFALGQVSTESPDTVRMHQRLEIARQYLIAAGIDAPSELNASNLPQLRLALRNWIAAQTATGEAKPQPDSHDADTTAPAVSGDAILKYAYPTKSQRFLRLMQYKADAQEQPKTILAQIPGTKTTFATLNPDHVLWKHSIIFNFAELYPTSSDVSSIYDSLQKTGLRLTGDGPCGKPDDEGFIDCLRRVRKRDIFWRGVSGVTATLSRSRNPRFVQSTIIPEATFESGLENSYSGQVDFDPKNLFPSGTDWKSVKTALEGAYKVDPRVKKPVVGSEGKLQDPPDASGSLRQALRGLDDCGDQPISSDCLKGIAGPRLRWRVVSALVPTYTFKVQSQFDFIKNTGGEFVSPPFPENHLWSMSFTADLRRAVDSIKSRTDAVEVMQVLAGDKAMVDKACDQINFPEVSTNTFFYYRLPNSTKLKWSFDVRHRDQCDSDGPKENSDTLKEGPCEKVDNISLQDGVLTGYPTQRRKLYLTVKDAAGYTPKDAAGDPKSCVKEVPITTTVSGALQQLLLSYLELSISPELVLDDDWFRTFRNTVGETLFARLQQGTATAQASTAPSW